MEVKAILLIGHTIDASVRVPGSKSLTNRALLIAALADGSTHLTNALFSDDSRYFAEALKTLGFEVVLDPERSGIAISGRGGRIPTHEADLFIGNAGTAARFLTAFLTLGEGEYVLDGDARMRQRPIGDLVTALNQLGGNVKPTSDAKEASSICPPVRVIASRLRGGVARLPGDVSSQFLSALLMVAPNAEEPVELTITTELNSRPYVDMTIGVMSDFGVEVEREDYRCFHVRPGRYQARENYPIESDASAASYFFAAPAILGGSVRVENISRRSKQGDITFLDVLEKMGCVVDAGDDSIEVSCSGDLNGIDFDMCNIPDTAQTLAVIAPFAKNPTRIRGIASARLKESDRVAATCAELSRLGVRVDEHPDGMTIYPCQDFRPAQIQTYNDHRMAMAFSLIGLRVPGVTIENPDCVSKTFPNYFDVLEKLR